MTINIADNAPRANYTATSGQTVFTVSFEFFDEADLTVYINGTETSAYTVTGGDGSTGTVTLTSGATAGDKVAIVRDVAIERTTDFTEGAAISRSALNEQLDKLTAQIADIDDRASRSLQLNDHEVAVGITLPATDDRKGKVLGFNATTGNVEAGPTLADTQSLADVSADIATLADIEDGTDATDAIQTAAGIASDISTVSGISSDVTTVSGNITDIQNASTNAATATTKAAEAATSASNAATSESNAATSASSASSAQASAESARDATLAAFDSFDDRYLGAKTSDPSVDNDGNALVGGALYYNSTDEVMKVYTGSSWVAAYASLSGALLVNNNLSDLGNAATARTNLGLGTAATSAATDFVAVTGDAMTGNLTFGDNVKAQFGDSNDLQIYHDGSNSIIKENGTGNLRIFAENFQLYSNADNATMMRGLHDGAVELYYDGIEKLATTSTGVDVTGTLVADGIDIQGDGTISGGSRITVTDIADINNDGIRFDDNTTSLYNNLSQDASGNFVLQHYTGSTWQNNLTVSTGGNLTVAGTAIASTDTDTTNTGTVTLDFGANQNFVLTLTGNVTLANPTTEQVGQSGFIVFIQDSTGGRTVSLGTDYETAGGAGLTLSSAASTTDVVPYIVAASGRILLGAPQLAFA